MTKKKGTQKNQYMLFQQSLLKVCCMFKQFTTGTSRISALVWHSDTTFTWKSCL